MKTFLRSNKRAVLIACMRPNHMRTKSLSALTLKDVYRTLCYLRPIVIPSDLLLSLVAFAAPTAGHNILVLIVYKETRKARLPSIKANLRFHELKWTSILPTREQMIWPITTIIWLLKQHRNRNRSRWATLDQPPWIFARFPRTATKSSHLRNLFRITSSSILDVPQMSRSSTSLLSIFPKWTSTARAWSILCEG